MTLLAEGRCDPENPTRLLPSAGHRAGAALSTVARHGLGPPVPQDIAKLASCSFEEDVGVQFSSLAKSSLISLRSSHLRPHHEPPWLRAQSTTMTNRHQCRKVASMAMSHQPLQGYQPFPWPFCISPSPGCEASQKPGKTRLGSLILVWQEVKAAAEVKRAQVWSLLWLA